MIFVRNPEPLKTLDHYDLQACLEYNPQPNLKFEDIAEIMAEVPGEADGPDWHWVLRTHDNRFFLLEGGCDYTGWD